MIIAIPKPIPQIPHIFALVSPGITGLSPCMKLGLIQNSASAKNNANTNK
jgi:hypothetical protein